MYKKLLLSSLALMAVSGLSAKHLTPQEALSRAMSQPASGMSKAPAARMTMTRAIVTSDNTDAVYVFQGDGNALVLPADDRVAPVLGYIDGQTDGAIPPQMEWWLSEYARQIEFMMSKPETGTGLYLNTRQKAANADKAPISPMVSTRWNQDSPYNSKCPIVSGSKSMTGCVATAAAQVMKYHNYPAEGTGTISYKDGNTNTTRTLTFDGKPFDWDNMLDKYTGSYNTIQRDAVAYLMQAVGYASQMSYSPEASGAQSPTMVEGMKKYFGYNEKIVLLNRQNFPLAQWEDLVYENLQKVGPVYYAGDDNIQGGHAFVCDGYSSDGFFHFNWGWGGSYDGYFKLTALNPEGQGIGGNSGGFNFGQEAAFNFTKPGAPVIEIPAVSPLLLLGNLTATRDSRYDLLLSSDMASSYGVFFYNTTGATVNVELGLKAVNISTGQESIQGEGDKISLPMFGGYKSYYLPIPDDLEDGNYRMYFMARDYPDGEWLEVAHDISNVNYANVTISNGVVASVSNATVNELEAHSLDVLTSVFMGCPLKISYTVENNTEAEIFDGITPALFTISNGQAVPKGVCDTYAVDLLPGQSITLELTPTLYAYENSSSFTGNAYIGLISDNTSKILDYVPVTVGSSPASPSVSGTEFSFIGDKTKADANNLQFNCGLKVTKGYWAQPFSVYICNLSGSTILHTISSKETYFLEAGQSETSVVSGSFPDAVEGNNYVAVFGYVPSNSYYLKEIDNLTFKVGATSGIETTEAESEAKAMVIADRQAGALSVVANTEISDVEAWSLDGRCLSLDLSIDGTRAGAPLSTLPSGVVIVKVTLADGTSTIAKVVK